MGRLVDSNCIMGMLASKSEREQDERNRERERERGEEVSRKEVGF